ncbi:hypothetical protein [Winogradskyella sp. A3E31]|uniref:hypothetical protein n=1 Tax=Winogradskyella sp. A3E31 TaxID=3349637 RepID=UPI00398B99EB
MKTKVTLLLMALLVGFNTSHAQQDEECMTWLQIFAPYAKSKRYAEAYEPWSKLRNKCPKFNQAIYAYGDNILEYKIENSTGEEQKGHINDLLKVYTQYNEYFSSKFPEGKMYVEQAQLMYKYRKELGLSDEEIYNKYNDAFTKDKENFTSPQGLYTYFSLMVDMFDAKKREAQEMFDKYDDVSDKILTEVDDNTEKLNKLVEKEEGGAALSKREGALKKQYTRYLEVFDQISESMDKKLGDRANCEVLIPLYEKDFEEYKNDAVWLKRSVSRMYNKECTDSELYTKLVKQYDATAPTADTKYFVATLLYAQGKDSEADKYIEQSYNLETDKAKKARLANRIAKKFKSSGKYGQARKYYREALSLNPSDGSPYIQIAIMYANSANNCGADTFDKRAVFWYAANEAEKAGRVDPRLKSTAAQYAANYRAKAPTKADIFSRGNSGQTINIGCWIGGSVVVP